MFILLFSCLSVASAVEFEITNKEIGATWVGIQGNAGKPALENGGFILEKSSKVREIFCLCISLLLYSSKILLIFTIAQVEIFVAMFF